MSIIEHDVTIPFSRYMSINTYLYRYIYNNQGSSRHGAANAGDDFGSGLSERSSQEWTTGHCRLIL